MQYFQILACNEAVGTCCNDYGLVAALDIMRKVFDIIQLIAPILLIVMATVQFTKLVATPDEKNGTKKVINKFLAAVFIFFTPVLTDMILSLMPANQNFQIGACWEQAKVSNEVLKLQESKHIKNGDKTGSSFIVNPEEYAKGNGNSSGAGEGSAKGKAIVAYAKSFVGKSYLYGGSWNGEKPYTPTDCSGFVQGVFKHHGITLKRSTSTQWADTSSYTKVNESQIKAGDLVMYDGHVGIITGNGKEIVHAQSPRTGIVISKDYSTCSSKAILGFMRIKGVN